LDSQAKETVQIVKEAIDFKSVDFLYIDADHSYEGIKADYENYTPLVKPGGIVGFHDTNHPPIKRLLLEKGHTRLKFYDYGFGTGIINGW
jgi:predicted O-methyltransferase YrrM